MGNDNIDNAKTNNLLSIHDLMTIAKNRNDNRSAAKLAVHAEILERLNQRIERNKLPEGYVRSIINHVRLEALIILADMKLVLMIEKQELVAPTAKLKQETHKRLLEIIGHDTPAFDRKDPSCAKKLLDVEDDLKAVSVIEHLLHENLL